MNKYNGRSQSPSAIPVFLRKRSLSASADNLSHTRPPSPVKHVFGSRIPTPTGKKIHRGNSEPNLSTHEASINNGESFKEIFLMSSNENTLDFGEQLEEMLIPSSPTEWHHESLQPLFIEDEKLNFGVDKDVKEPVEYKLLHTDKKENNDSGKTSLVCSKGEYCDVKEDGCKFMNFVFKLSHNLSKKNYSIVSFIGK